MGSLWRDSCSAVSHKQKAGPVNSMTSTLEFLEQNAFVGHNAVRDWEAMSPYTRSVAPHNGKRVLVADDHADGREALTLLLEHEGYVVASAADGLSAVELTESFQPSIAILDIGMPGLNGYEVAGRLRRSGMCPGLVLIALSGWGQEQDKIRAAEAGFDHHFTKPVDLDRLLTMLAALQPR